MDSKLARPALHLEAIEEHQRNQSRIYRHAVDSRRDIGHAVEEVLDRGGAPALEIHRLRPTDVTAAPEVDPRNLGQEVAQCGRVPPFDGVAGKNNPGQRGTGALDPEER